MDSSPMNGKGTMEQSDKYFQRDTTCGNFVVTLLNTFMKNHLQ